MLDISKITEKIPKIGKYLRQEASANSQKLERGRTILQEAQKQQAKQGTSKQPKGEKKGAGKKEEKVVDAEFEEVNKKDNKKSA